MKLVSSNNNNYNNNKRQTGQNANNRAGYQTRNDAGRNAGQRAGSGAGPYRNGGGGNRKPDKPANKRKSAVKTTLIILLVIAIGVAGLFISLGFYVRSLETIFPNVWVDGIKLSGLTLEEAADVLINEGYESNAEGISATVVFPDDSRITITGDQVGLSLDAYEAASGAFSFGRDSSFFDNELVYINALFNRIDLRDLSVARYDDSIVREIVNEYTQKFNETLLDSDLNVTDDRIVIVKGTGLEQADEAEVYDLMIFTLQQAAEKNEHLVANYTTSPTDDFSVDLQIIFDRIHEEPVSSVYDPDSMSGTASTEGRTFDLDAAQEMIDNAEFGETVTIPIIILEPELSKEELDGMLFRDVLGECTTTIGGTSNRLQNITIAAGFINETILNPEDVFSFNAIVGKRESSRGFRPAPAYVGGGKQDEVGGGICQVSSTIYDAVLHADLEVVERRAHGMVVSYMPRDESKGAEFKYEMHGHDATVDYNIPIDLKFKNNTEFPVRIDVTISGGKITAKLIGTKLDTNYIKLKIVLISHTPSVTERVDDEELEVGQEVNAGGGFNGYVVETYKVLYDKDGNILSETRVDKSNYKMVTSKILVGTKPLPPPPPTTTAPPTEPPDPPPEP